MGFRKSPPKNIRFDGDLDGLIQSYASANGRNFSDAVNWLVRIGLAREGLVALPRGAVTAGTAESPLEAPAHTNHPRAAGRRGE